MGQSLSDKIDEVRREVGEVREMLASWPSADEIVTRDVYTSDKHGVEERLRRLEASPQRALGYIGGGVGCLGLILSGVMLLFYIGAFVLTHYKP